MRSFVLAMTGLLLGLATAKASPLNLIMFGGGLSWPLFVAQDQAIFARHGLEVHLTETPGSVFQMKGLYDGTFDVAMTPFDNVVAYDQGQGEAPLDGAPDVFAFMGGISGALRLLASPSIKSVAELRGRTLGVDSPATGYTLLMYELLARQGLPLGSYDLARTGGTTFRVQALEAGQIAATMVSSPQEIEPEAKGFRRLGDIQATVGPYQALCGVARRAWAAAHRDSLLAYIRAYVEADAWLRDPAHHDEAIAVYLRHVRGATPAVADAALRIMLSPSEGFQPRAAFDAAGADNVVAIRARYGTPRKPAGDWRQFADDTFYRDALASPE